MRESWLDGHCTGRKSSPGSLRDAPPAPCSGPPPVEPAGRPPCQSTSRPGRLAGEGRMWHLGVVLFDEERDENAKPLNRVEGVEVEPLVFQRTPERLDHRVGIGNIELCEDALH